MKKLFSNLHLWLSIPFGIIISIICITGAILVFETELTQIFNKSKYYVQEVKSEPLKIDELIEKIKTQIPDSLSISNITIPSNPKQTYRLGIQGMARANIYADQYSGEVTAMPTSSNTFFSTTRRLHRWLLDSYKRDSFSLGKTVVGVSTIVFVFILISGIIIWIPKTYKTLKSRLSIKVDKGWWRFWYDLHLAGGMYTALLLLLMALTGLTWSFTWYRSSFYKVFGVENVVIGSHSTPSINPQGNRGQGGEGRGNRGENNLPTYQLWNNVVNNIKSEYDDFKTITIQNGSATVSLAKLGNARASDRLTFNPQTGEITERTLYKDLDKSAKIRGWIFSLHVGSWGGIFTKILTFIAAVIGGTLPLTGYYLWIKRLLRKRKLKQTIR